METNKIYHGNSLKVLKTFADNSIDCCITSPPYWGLRDYGHEEQLGNEPHFNDFIKNLCDIFDEVKRVLKDTGTCFVNLGDTYATKSGNMHSNSLPQPKNKRIKQSLSFEQPNIGMHKSLCMVPERFAIEMVNRGWTLRNQIIWHKPNQMPSSVTDRFTVDFEKVFFFVKNSMGYYFEQQYTISKSKSFHVRNRDDSKLNNTPGRSKMNGLKTNHYETANMRTVWSINTKGISDTHFAIYPQELVERMLKAGCPEKGTVIDPFFGSGTTGIYARKVNRDYIGIELNKDYIEVAKKRLYDELGMFL